MTGISAIGASGAFGLSSSGSGKEPPLTPATKAELERLGFDTSNIKTEAEGQALLKNSLTTQVEQKSTISKEDEAKKLTNEVKELADKIGVKYSSFEKAEDIMSKIKAKIDEIKVEAAQKTNSAQNVSQKSLINDCEQEYKTLEAEFSNSEKAKEVLSASLNNLAMLNKISPKLH